MKLPNQERMRAWRERYASHTGCRPLIARHNAQIIRGLSFPVSIDSTGCLRLQPLPETVASNLWRLT